MEKGVRLIKEINWTVVGTTFLVLFASFNAGSSAFSGSISSVSLEKAEE
jgi:hypothetical protein